MSMNEAMNGMMNGMMNQGNVTAAQAVEQFGADAYASPIVQAAPTQVTEPIEQAEPKMYEIRPLNARDIFPMTKIIRKIGLKDFGKCFEPEEIKAITDTFSENSEEKSMEDLAEIIYVFLTIFLYLLKCPQSFILSALRAFCFCGKPRISRSIFLYFRYQAWLKSW